MSSLKWKGIINLHKTNKTNKKYHQVKYPLPLSNQLLIILPFCQILLLSAKLLHFCSIGTSHDNSHTTTYFCKTASQNRTYKRVFTFLRNYGSQIKQLYKRVNFGTKLLMNFIVGYCTFLLVFKFSSSN